ncbi:phosphatase PAP2 family protein [Methylocystis heyeri]|uniref:Acid phosphatase n=1 Tax=Methylocystis heyeri TaxID=391905 RepID=A0A6B8KDL4_9HYPH|nr:phosphatase PAP2 family protein [Methylocystis heyeri]QGM45105.1 phosphatase PAP2 family protein [Methylocystis heyeri]
MRAFEVFFSALTSLVLFCGAPAQAREANFVSPDQLGLAAMLPDPPADGADATKAELAELHRLEGARTEAEIASARFDEENENIFAFKSVLGDSFTMENLPLTAALGVRVKNDEGLDTALAKAAFHRVRPYNFDKTLHPVCKTKDKADAYPSGHATSGYLFALTLVDMVPEKREQLLARASDYAHNRLICGVHYASDLEASKLAAYALHAQMSLSAQYRSELAAARAELRQKLGFEPAR